MRTLTSLPVLGPVLGTVLASSRRSGDLAFGLPVLIAVIQVLGTIGASRGQPERAAVDALTFALLLLGPAALVFRARWPAATVLVVQALTLVYLLREYPYGPFMVSPVVATIYAVRNGHRLVAWLAMGGLLAGHVGLGTLFGLTDPPNLTGTLIVASWMLLVLIAAEGVRVRHERVQEERRARQAESAGRLTEERLRLARELHDVVAHNISLINVQAGVALHLMDAQPEQARTALTAIKQASKEALVELRSVLGVLRQVDGEAPRQPTPGVARLEELAGRTRAAGLDVRVRTEGEHRALPSGVDVVVYRIVQEALTNVLRHADASRADVRLSYGDKLLTVEVTDDGRGATAVDLRNGGSGLAGVRERVASLGGEVAAGPLPQPGGGFRVRAEFPLDGGPTGRETAG